VIVTPKAVSDSQNSQTCLDPDASRVSLSILLCFLVVFLSFLKHRANWKVVQNCQSHFCYLDVLKYGSVCNSNLWSINLVLLIFTVKSCLKSWSNVVDAVLLLVRYRVSFTKSRVLGLF
jgi:hypothetical protein